MSGSKITMPKRQIVSFLTVAVLLTIILLPAANASAAVRLTEPEEIDGVRVDGIAADVHNSYAWCAAIFTQDDGNDYLWVGTNRDLGAANATAMGIDGTMYELLGIPAADTDTAAKIFRCNLGDPDAGWELMWSEDPFSGYNKMLVFDGDLYVLVGTSVEAKGNYAAVYRFAPDFGSDGGQAAPDVVMWSLLPKGTDAYYLAAAVSEDGGALFVGTSEGLIYSTDGTGLAPFDTSAGFTGTGWTVGWTVLGDVNDLFVPVSGDDNRIWDLIAFNGCLYAFVTGEYGFMVFKYDLTNDVWTQTVGWEQSAGYPAGLGISKHVSASPFLASFDGTDYVYVSTFANGPRFIKMIGEGMADPGILSGNMEAALSDHYCPAAVYRFDANDYWEVVAGDKNGDNVAYDSLGYKVPNVGNLNAGFSPSTERLFPGSDVFPNISPNQYVWYMAQDANGRLWASTWDIGVFREKLKESPEYISMMQLGIITSNDVIADLLALVPGADLDIWNIGPDFQISLPAGAVVLFAAEMADAILRGAFADMSWIVQQLLLAAAAMTDDPLGAVNALGDLFTTFASDVSGILSAQGAAGSLSDMMETLMNFTLLVNDTTNPAGFDLFYTDDGVNWEPYTVNGLGDADNYGGRVLIPSELGLIVMTANPFTGCQVWLLNDDGRAQGITADMPKSVDLSVGESFTFLAASLGVSPDLKVTVDSAAFRAEYRIVEVDPADYASMVVCIPWLTLGGLQWTEVGGYGYVYEITLTALEEFNGKIRVTVASGLHKTSGTIDAKVTSGNIGGGGSGGNNGGSGGNNGGGDTGTKGADGNDTAGGGIDLVIVIAAVAIVACISVAAFVVLRKP